MFCFNFQFDQYQDINHINKSSLGSSITFKSIKSPETKQFENNCSRATHPNTVYTKSPFPHLQPQLNLGQIFGPREIKPKLTKSDITQESELSLTDTEVYLCRNPRVH